jgi:hypothetical protein
MWLRVLTHLNSILSVFFLLTLSTCGDNSRFELVSAAYDVLCVGF